MSPADIAVGFGEDFDAELPVQVMCAAFITLPAKNGSQAASRTSVAAASGEFAHQSDSISDSEGDDHESSTTTLAGLAGPEASARRPLPVSRATTGTSGRPATKRNIAAAKASSASYGPGTVNTGQKLLHMFRFVNGVPLSETVRD